eukprot:09623.XXX_362332_362505_1 [CDS] Oithona nana genome sequencing.
MPVNHSFCFNSLLEAGSSAQLNGILWGILENLIRNCPTLILLADLSLEWKFFDVCLL